MDGQPQSTSVVIQEIIDACTRDGGQIRVGEFTSMLGDRAFCLAILVFSLPNSIPLPGIPGLSTITGLPITFIAAQMIVGRQTIWLPHNIANAAFSRALLGKMLTKALPGVIWVEKWLRPRWTWLASYQVERLLGMLFAALSLIIALPIPGGNFLPGLSMSLVAIGLLERDGLFLLFAMACAIGSIVLMAKIILLFFQTVPGWILGWF